MVDDRRRPPPYRLVSDYTQLFRRHLGLVLGITVLGLAGGTAGVILAPKAYTASTVVFVSSTGVGDANPGKGRAANGIDLDTELSVAQSAEVLAAAGRAVQVPASDLRDELTLAIPPNSTTMRISITDGNAEFARVASTAVASAYLEYRRSTADAVLKQQIASRQTDIAALDAKIQTDSSAFSKLPKASPGRTTLQSDITLLSAQRNELARHVEEFSTVRVTGGRMLTPASRPKKPTSPLKPLWISSGLFLGIVVGFGAASIRERVERRLRRRGDVEASFGVPVLAELRGDHQRDPHGEHLGGQDFSRASTEVIARVTPGGRLLLATGVTPGASSTDVAAHLAGAIARSGYDVLLVFTEESSMRAAAQLGAAYRHGLSDVILHGVDPVDASRPHGTIRGLRVLGPGADAVEAGERLASAEGNTVLRKLRGAADYVVLAGGVASENPEAVVLGERSDGVIVVVERRTTLLADVAATQRLLGRSSIIGAVIVDAARTSKDALPV